LSFYITYYKNSLEFVWVIAECWLKKDWAGPFFFRKPIFSTTDERPTIVLNTNIFKGLIENKKLLY
jgi:hypothetical protein